MSKPKIVAVVGTNASGKSALGIRLAKQFEGEIISADSRQVFRGLDLGSGKVTTEEMQGVPHYLIDVREPGEFFSMADFQKMSYEKIEEIRSEEASADDCWRNGTLCGFRAGWLSAF